MVELNLDIDTRQKMGMSIHGLLFLVFLVYVGGLWYYDMTQHILEAALFILIVSTVVEFINLGGRLTHRSLVSNMVILIACIYFLMNGVGQTLSFADSIGLAAYPPNVNFLIVLGMDISFDLFSQIVTIPEVGVCVAFAILGGILINMGDAADNISLYMAGTLVATILPLIVCLGVLLGWIPPAEYFFALGGSAANILEFAAVLGIIVLILSVVYMFDDIISSATAGER